MNEEEINKLSNRIIGLAIKVHKILGPGFVEKIYEKAIEREFNKEGMKYEKQKLITVSYDNIELGRQRIDYLIENEIIVELKTITKIIDIHTAQLLSYLKTANKRLGLILNFAKTKLDIKRMVYNL